MIPDANSLTEMSYQFFLGSFNGEWIILGLIVLAIVAILLVLAKAKAATVVVCCICVIFLFSLFSPEFFFMFWIAIIACGVLLANGIRKQFTGQ